MNFKGSCKVSPLKHQKQEKLLSSLLKATGSIRDRFGGRILIIISRLNLRLNEPQIFVWRIWRWKCFKGKRKLTYTTGFKKKGLFIIITFYFFSRQKERKETSIRNVREKEWGGEWFSRDFPQSAPVYSSGKSRTLVFEGLGNKTKKIYSNSGISKKKKKKKKKIG